MKLQLTKSLLEMLEQLKKAMDDIDDLQKILSEKESEIASLQSLSTQDNSYSESKGPRAGARFRVKRARDRETSRRSLSKG